MEMKALFITCVIMLSSCVSPVPRPPLGQALAHARTEMEYERKVIKRLAPEILNDGWKPLWGICRRSATYSRTDDGLRSIHRDLLFHHPDDDPDAAGRPVFRFIHLSFVYHVEKDKLDVHCHSLGTAKRQARFAVLTEEFVIKPDKTIWIDKSQYHPPPGREVFE